LGEFSPVGRLFSMGSFLLQNQPVLGIFFPRKKLCINSDKNGLGYIQGEFLANSFGHSGLWRSWNGDNS
jgi:hypothetical protein